MLGELELWGIVSRRLEAAGVPYMLTGSFALAFYATPRMTRVIDWVIAPDTDSLRRLIEAFSPDFYVDGDAANEAVQTQRMFNLMHLESGIKIDFIIRKQDAYRELEFARRQPARIGDIDTWIVSREDLLLSKLVWAADSQSELQLRDVKSLVDSSLDDDYLRRWAETLGVLRMLERVYR
ncbi:MAG: hypothetical protein ACT4NL_11065 [Pseudomarimonas sp.]